MRTVLAAFTVEAILTFLPSGNGVKHLSMSLLKSMEMYFVT